MFSSLLMILFLSPFSLAADQSNSSNQYIRGYGRDENIERVRKVNELCEMIEFDSQAKGHLWVKAYIDPILLPHVNYFVDGSSGNTVFKVSVEIKYQPTLSDNVQQYSNALLQYTLPDAIKPHPLPILREIPTLSDGLYFSDYTDVIKFVLSKPNMRSYLLKLRLVNKAFHTLCIYNFKKALLELKDARLDIDKLRPLIDVRLYPEYKKLILEDIVRSDPFQELSDEHLKLVKTLVAKETRLASVAYGKSPSYNRIRQLYGTIPPPILIAPFLMALLGGVLVLTRRTARQKETGEGSKVIYSIALYYLDYAAETIMGGIVWHIIRYMQQR